MSGKLIKGLIIGVILIIIIVTILLLSIIKDNYSNENSEYFISAGDAGEITNPNLHSVTDKEKYYAVRNCINNYLDALNTENHIFYLENGYDENAQKEYLYNILSQSYKNSKNITQQNVLKNIKLQNEQLFFTPIEIKTLESATEHKYIAYGIIQNLDNNYKGDLYIIVRLDGNNETYEIEPLEKTYTSIDEITITAENTKIEANNYNKYITPDVNTKYISNEYLKSYMALALSKPEIIYNLLLEEYREKRFTSLESFKKYVLDNKEIISNLKLNDYKLNINEEYLEYVAKDQFGNTYIFRENNEIDYTIQLDDYTLTNTEFIQQYEEATNMNKGVMNIQKFIEMINTQDYTSAYNVLDENFKQNYFKTQTEFETYVKNTLFKYNVITDGEYIEIASLHSYKIILADATGKNKNKIELNVVMKLLEGTDFVMSFEV